MRPKDTANPRSSMWDLMGYYLRFLRNSRGMTGADAARAMGVAPSTISRIETGEQQMTEKHANKIDRAWKTGSLFSLLIYYARRASDPDWFKNLREFEQIATELRIFGALLVPGLVQTPGYARALLEAGRNADVERDLQNRLDRQAMLDRLRPPEVWVTISESVLYWPVGGPEVMKEQLTHLLELSERRNVFMRVVPRSTGAYEGLDGPFQVVETPEGAVAFVDAAVEGRLVVDADEVHAFRNRFDRIGAKALSEDLSRSLVRGVLERINDGDLA